jgi:hypothetical protein
MDVMEDEEAAGSEYKTEDGSCDNAETETHDRNGELS